MGKLKCVDFFCGGGGMSQGLSRACIKVLGALDNDPDCRTALLTPPAMFLMTKLSPPCKNKR